MRIVWAEEGGKERTRKMGAKKVVIDSDMLFEPDLEGLGLADYEIYRLQYDEELILGETDRVVYLLSMLSGGLAYQINFIEKNMNVAQWLIVAYTDNPRTIHRFRDMLHDMPGSFHMVQAGQKETGEVAKLISGVKILHQKSCLIYSKRPFTGKKSVAALLKAQNPKWKFEICEGNEEEFGERSCEMSKVLIIGRSFQDFSIAKPENLESMPLLLYNRADENWQLCVESERLWQQVRMALCARSWEFPADYPYFYVGSARYEKWRHMESEEADMSFSLLEDFVIWDRFGLPLPHRDYTPEYIHTFLARFDAVERIGAHLETNH